MELKKRILLAEDEQDARRIYVDILTQAGYQVDGVEDGLETLKKCASEKYDLILLDIIMPNLDGIGALKELEEHPEKYGNNIIYMLTNIGSDLAIEKAVTLGARGYILKSDTGPEDLIKQVDEVFSGKN